MQKDSKPYSCWIGKKAKITVVEENQTTVADFETNSLGMGSIPLVLQAGKNTSLQPFSKMGLQQAQPYRQC
jgi:hypothetical protein